MSETKNQEEIKIEITNITKYIWEHDENRYALGTIGEHPLIFIGLNPSSAIPGHPDKTYQELENLSKNHIFKAGATQIKCDSIILLNLYPQVLTKEDRLQIESDKNYSKVLDSYSYSKNFAIIEKIFNDVKEKDYVVLLGWGDGIIKRPNKDNCLKKIKDILTTYKKENIFTLGLSTKGQPYCPIPPKKEFKVQKFDIKKLC